MRISDWSSDVCSSDLPDSVEVNEAIGKVDESIGELIADLAAIHQPAHLLIVADHGMRAVDAAQVIQLADLIDLPSIIAVETGPYAAIEQIGRANAELQSIMRTSYAVFC